MVRIHTKNGYIISIIQSTKGSGRMMECMVWPNNNPKGETIDIKSVDATFMDEDDLIKVIEEVHKLPVIPW